MRKRAENRSLRLLDGCGDLGASALDDLLVVAILAVLLLLIFIGPLLAAVVDALTELVALAP